MNSIHKRIDNLSRDDRKTAYKIIAEQILKDFSNSLFRSQDKLAKKCYVSKSTITQFAKIAKCSGFRELQIKLRIEYENNFLQKNKIIKRKLRLKIITLPLRSGLLKITIF